MPAAGTGSGEGLDLYWSILPCVLLDRIGVTKYVYVDLRAFMTRLGGIRRPRERYRPERPAGLHSRLNASEAKFQISGRRFDTPIGEHSPWAAFPVSDWASRHGFNV